MAVTAHTSAVVIEKINVEDIYAVVLIIHPSISTYPFPGHGEQLEPIPAVLGQEAGHTLHSLSQGTLIHRENYSHYNYNYNGVGL